MTFGPHVKEVNAQSQVQAKRYEGSVFHGDWPLERVPGSAV